MQITMVVDSKGSKRFRWRALESPGIRKLKGNDYCIIIRNISDTRFILIDCYTASNVRPDHFATQIK